MSDFLKETPIAHRGLHLGCPENSLPAFREAILHGYAIETDVHIARDGVPVVFHDDNLLRMTGVDREIARCNSGDLGKLRLGGTDEKILTLSEFLEEIGGRTPLLIELKQDPIKPKQFAETVARIMREYRGEYAIQSFHPLYVRAYKRLCPEIKCGVLAASRLGLGGFAGRVKTHIVREMSLNFYVKPDFASYCLEDLPAPCMEKFGGIKLCWTVRSETDERRARRYADNIIFENYLAKQRGL